MSHPEELHPAAVLTRLRAFFTESYDADEVPEQPEYPILVVHTDQGSPAATRASAATSWTRWRIVVQYHATTAAGARVAAARQRQALDMHRPVVDGFKTTRCRVESTVPVGKESDDDRSDSGEQLFIGTTVWVFGSMPQAN